jgi:hypothetical protein
MTPDQRPGPSAEALKILGKLGSKRRQKTLVAAGGERLS